MTTGAWHAPVGSDLLSPPPRSFVVVSEPVSPGLLSQLSTANGAVQSLSGDVSRPPAASGSATSAKSGPSAFSSTSAPTLDLRSSQLGLPPRPLRLTPFGLAEGGVSREEMSDEEIVRMLSRQAGSRISEEGGRVEHEDGHRAGETSDGVLPQVRARSCQEA